MSKLAQKRVRPRSWRGWHGNGDFATAWDLARHYCVSDESIEAYLKWLDIRTTSRLNRVWEWVEVVALDLLDRDEIAGEKLPALLTRAIALLRERRETSTQR